MYSLTLSLFETLGQPSVGNRAFFLVGAVSLISPIVWIWDVMLGGGTDVDSREIQIHIYILPFGFHVTLESLSNVLEPWFHVFSTALGTLSVLGDIKSSFPALP
jgi:hypothetical protein